MPDRDGPDVAQDVDRVDGSGEDDECPEFTCPHCGQVWADHRLLPTYLCAACGNRFKMTPARLRPSPPAGTEGYVRFRNGLRNALHPWWRSNPLVGDDEIVEAVRRAVRRLALVRRALTAPPKKRYVSAKQVFREFGAAPPTQEDASFDHSDRTEPYWEPGLGPCVCDDCRKLRATPSPEGREDGA